MDVLTRQREAMESVGIKIPSREDLERIDSDKQLREEFPHYSLFLMCANVTEQLEHRDLFRNAEAILDLTDEDARTIGVDEMKKRGWRWK